MQFEERFFFFFLNQRKEKESGGEKKIEISDETVLKNPRLFSYMSQ